LGVTSQQAIATLPGITPLSEQGFADFEAISWNAILAPARTPAVILERLHKVLAELLASEEIKNKFASQYFSTVGSSPNELKQRIQDEKRRWDAVIEDLKLSLD
jgi:tripartite-type tricarboxylate transporter receptor subunit TctC